MNRKDSRFIEGLEYDKIEDNIKSIIDIPSNCNTLTRFINIIFEDRLRTIDNLKTFKDSEKVSFSIELPTMKKKDIINMIDTYYTEPTIRLLKI